MFYIAAPWTGPLPKQLPPAASESLLFLWTPPAKLGEALRAIERWRFRYQNCLVWAAPASRHSCALEQHDLLLLAGQRIAVEQVSESHRIRPEADAIYKMIEQVCPEGPKAHLFADPREGWEVVG